MVCGFPLMPQRLNTQREGPYHVGIALLYTNEGGKRWSKLVLVVLVYSRLSSSGGCKCFNQLLLNQSQVDASWL